MKTGLDTQDSVFAYPNCAYGRGVLPQGKTYGGIRRGMTERPFAELTFPWLKVESLETETSEIKTVEQSPK